MSEKSSAAKVAVTASLLFMLIVQVPVPEQGALHPVNVDVEFGVAVRVTTVPGGKKPEHDVVQLIAAGPPGLLVIVPPPAPEKVTSSMSSASKVAVTD